MPVIAAERKGEELMIDDAYLNAAQALARMDESELFDKAYAELNPDRFAIGDEDENGRRRAVTGWLADNAAQLQKAVCGPATARLRNLEGTSRDAAALIIGVADLIADAVVGISPLTVAAILVKIGLDRFCNNA